MKVYLISDTHFFHDKMVQYCGRPENHTEIIRQNLFKVGFTKDDLLIHLGDVCLGKDEWVHNLFIKPLQAKKWLLRGNHDSKSDHWYLTHGWDWVGESFTNTYFGKKILFSHTPQKIDETYDLMIHGHFHNQLPRLLEKKFVVPDEEYRNKHDIENLTPKHKLFVLEDLEYKPILLERFIV